ncbi:hypothetical protein Bbelb_180460 [Branchiostoma belcheri]|nr:hypothetical protein Bbelb_180460 [Branchiostoma belcheri]
MCALRVHDLTRVNFLAGVEQSHRAGVSYPVSGQTLPLKQNVERWPCLHHTCGGSEERSASRGTCQNLVYGSFGRTRLRTFPRPHDVVSPTVGPLIGHFRPDFA